LSGDRIVFFKSGFFHFLAFKVGLSWLDAGTMGRPFFHLFFLPGITDSLGSLIVLPHIHPPYFG